MDEIQLTEDDGLLYCRVFDEVLSDTIVHDHPSFSCWKTGEMRKF